jgi:putative copper resistance protein D
VGGAAPDVTRLRVAAGAVLVVAAASVMAWSLAYPQGALTATLVRAVADCAAVVTLGLAVVPMLDDARHRAELKRNAATPLAAASALWLAAELTRMVVAAADAAAVPLRSLGADTTLDFALDTTSGHAGLVSLVAAAMCAASALAPRAAPLPIVVAGAAALGVVARSLTGHLADSALGGLAVAVHTLAAALWCGVLAGVVLTVEHRGQWARVLPRFSQLALICVIVLLVGGTVSAGLQLESPSDLYATGYGRVLSAKLGAALVLVVMGWRNRTMWLPAARSHNATAVVSRSRSLIELAVMTLALALAAGLAVTG